MKKLISHQISPHLFLLDFFRGFFALLTPKNFQKKIDFSPYFGTKDYLLLNSARNILSIIAEILEKNMGEEKNLTIAIPSFCCSVMATPFLSKGWKIIWLDTNKNGQVDANDLQDFLKKVRRNKEKVFHTLLLPQIFGQNIDWEKIEKICKNNKIILIQDLAHSFNPLDNKTYGDYQIYSFGREKTISCVSGGALTASDKQNFIQIKTSPHILTKFTSKLPHLLHILVYSLSIPFYYQGGKILPFFVQKFKLLPLAVTKGEKSGNIQYYPEFLPYERQKILLNQCKKFKKSLTHQKNCIKWWKESIEKISEEKNFSIKLIQPDNAFRLIVIFADKKILEKIKKISAKNGFLFREWDGVPISPIGVDLERFGYHKGDCPNAEFFAEHYLTLPCNERVKEKDVRKWEKIMGKSI